MNNQELSMYINSGKLDDILIKISDGNLIKQKERYNNLLAKANDFFGETDYHIISSPGRTEIGGNHTDHQGGHVVAASLNVDNICFFSKREDDVCFFIDEKYGAIQIDINNLGIIKQEKNTSASLIRGIAKRLKELGYNIGGFNAICDSKVLIGSGISSSACFEVMIVEIFNYLYNQDKIEPIERAIIGRYAENVYFGKPCGLLDQLAISVGGFVAVDFKDSNNPIVENYDFDFSKYGYDLVIVNTKGNHANLSQEYAAIPNEIKDVCNYLGIDVLSHYLADDFFKRIKEIREAIKNDRAVLRCIHFYNEDKRAIAEKLAIMNNDFAELLELMNESGQSSFMFLQNVYPASQTCDQSLAIGLAITEKVLQNDGAKRVHGGGFQGTIQAIVPHSKLKEYQKEIGNVFGDDAIMVLKIRPFGTKTII